MNNIFRSVGAVIFGFLVVAILSTITDVALEAVGIFPPARDDSYVTWMFLFALVYRCAYTVLGGYVTAKLAPTNPKKHVWVLGIIGTVLALIGVFVGWNLSEHWYPISLVVTAIPCIMLGAKLSRRI